MGRKVGTSSSRMEDALVALFIPISRLLLTSRVGIGELVGAAKQAYVKAAISEAFPVDSRVNISRLSVATGMTRKEVSLLVDKALGRKDRSTSRVKEQRAIRVLRGWRADPRFHSTRGHPAQLPLQNGKRSFALLVKLYGGDVTPMSVLHELQRMNAVSVTKTGFLRMRASDRKLPSQTHGHLLEVARLMSDFASTIAEPRTREGASAFFGYRDCEVASIDEMALFRRTFAKRATAMLEGVDQWRSSRGKKCKTSSAAKRVGVGIYLVRDGQS